MDFQEEEEVAEGEQVVKDNQKEVETKVMVEEVVGAMEGMAVKEASRNSVDSEGEVTDNLKK